MILFAAQTARAEDSKNNDVREYYEGERRSGWLWGGFGIAGLGSGIALAAAQKDFTTGLAGPLIGFGALQTTIGILTLARGPARIRDIDAQLAADSRAFRIRDYERIQKINKAFIALGVVESFLIVSGAIILGAGVAKDVDSVRGLGLGIGIESAVMFFCDSLAHARAERYEASLAQ
jgi:hypothetical protein